MKTLTNRDVVDLLMMNCQQVSGSGLGGEWEEYRVRVWKNTISAPDEAKLRVKLKDYLDAVA